MSFTRPRRVLSFIAFALITFVLLTTRASAQSYTLTVGTSPVNITTTVPSIVQVTVQQQGIGNVTFFITDTAIPGTFQQAPGAQYVFRNAGGYAQGTTVGTIRVASNPPVSFTVTQVAS